MFYPPCPNCQKNTVESAEDEQVDNAARNSSMWLRHERAIGNSHHLAKAMVTGVVIGRAVWKRWPGGGLKRCTDCGFSFR